jgi:hypothetical protein
VSRGYGSTQRFILAILEEHPGAWWSAWDLAERRLERHPTRIEVQAMRNAMRRLEGAPNIALVEDEPYWGRYARLQDTWGEDRPKRVFPTLLIGRDATAPSVMRKEIKEWFQSAEIDANPDF